MLSNYQTAYQTLPLPKRRPCPQFSTEAAARFDHNLRVRDPTVVRYPMMCPKKVMALRADALRSTYGRDYKLPITLVREAEHRPPPPPPPPKQACATPAMAVLEDVKAVIGKFDSNIIIKSKIAVQILLVDIDPSFFRSL